MQLIGQSPAAIDDEVYDEILNCLRANVILKCYHNISSSEKKVYYFLKKGIFTFSRIYDPVYIVVKLIGFLPGKKEQQRYYLEKKK